ncbi:hypothetical protein QQS21_011476 [Conoideocrella luteorostrata]|uniref:HTH araC/xylS-type domain-containing protein n=1 Tax=Conoideocrella luteorostrata TaxID=1105319 RepID=A0AAJ0CFU2_9HYPO|nr:hypothetical protein QQS21_011476 [Conoideocrella luteorostrata]
MNQTHHLLLPSPTHGIFQDDPSRWRAVQIRDPLADGHFVYAVKTTKIYCRPICKARLARRANVTFYATGSEASSAGFRACKRCKPEMEGFMPEERAVCQIRKFVMEKASSQDGDEANQKLSLSQMARRTGLSKWHFHRVFKRTVGVTPFEYLRNETAAWDGDGVVLGETSWGGIGMDGYEDSVMNGGFDFGFLDSLLDTTDGSSESSGLRSAAGTEGDGSLWSFEDLVVWPEE